MGGFNHGDGGAFPEIHELQYPLDMGNPDKKSNALAVTTNSKGEAQSTALARQGVREEVTVYSSFSDLIPKEYEENDLARPCEEEIDDANERARKALEAKINGKIASLTPQGPDASQQTTYFRYNPSETAGGGEKVQGRMIKMVEQQKDPLEPSRFKAQRVPAGPPSPPAPVLHSPPRKLKMEDMQEWKVPPCISNWKNPKGYVIPLDKRLQADGRGLQEAQINPNFAKLTEALNAAESAKREEVIKRININKKKALKAKEKSEAKMKEEAMRAREQWDQLRDSRKTSDMSYEEIEEERKRNEIREDRRRKWEHERRIAAHKASGGRADKDGERDLNERIALGLGSGGGGGGDSYLDQRLFNQSSGGLGSNLEDVEGEGNAYTKSLLSKNDRKQSQFKANREMLDAEHRRMEGRSDTVRNIEFESTKEEDPFGMEAILDDVKAHASERKRRRSSSDEGDRRRKRH